MGSAISVPQQHPRSSALCVADILNQNPGRDVQPSGLHGFSNNGKTKLKMSRQIGQSEFAEGSEGLTGWMDLLLCVLLNN